MTARSQILVGYGLLTLTVLSLGFRLVFGLPILFGTWLRSFIMGQSSDYSMIFVSTEYVDHSMIGRLLLLIALISSCYSLGREDSDGVSWLHVPGLLFLVNIVLSALSPWSFPVSLLIPLGLFPKF